MDETLPTKRDLGIGYLAGVGCALTLSLLGYIWVTHESVLVVFISVFIAIALFATIVYIGYLFLEIDLSEAFVWNVAQWTAFGFGIAVLLSFAIGFSQTFLPSSALVPSLLVITIATGGLIGTLLGVITGLRKQHIRMREVTQRNTVMNRVLRHNIRNDMNVILGHTDLLAEKFAAPDDSSIQAIETTANSVVRLSKAAKHIDELTTSRTQNPIHVSSTIRDCITTVGEMFPEATFHTDIPDDVWVAAGPMIRSAIVNLFENSVEHNDSDPIITVSVERIEADPDRVRISIADNGPGIPSHQQEVLHAEREEPIRHGNGLGLWLVKWFTDQYNGTLRFAENKPRGAIVQIELPAADPPSNPSSAPDTPTNLPEQL